MHRFPLFETIVYYICTYAHKIGIGYLGAFLLLFFSGDNPE